MKPQRNLIFSNLKSKVLIPHWRAQATKIDDSTGTIATSVEFIGEASSQLNSLMFPIIASIGIIVALQITIIARRR